MHCVPFIKTVAHSKCSTLVAEARLYTILDRLVYHIEVVFTMTIFSASDYSRAACRVQHQPKKQKVHYCTLKLFLKLSFSLLVSFNALSHIL